MKVFDKFDVHETGAFNAQDAITNIKKDPNYQKPRAIALFIDVVREETTLKLKEKVGKLTLESYEEESQSGSYKNKRRLN